MGVQGFIVAVLVVLAGAYVFRTLAPRRWLWRFGIGRGGRAAGPGGAGAGGEGGGACGCSDCPATPKVHKPVR
ncbi:MAG: hypothetical protein U1F30_13570 [Steroidobacteraceae bacterium]